ncbi:hypothetical protein ITP53_08265 [Nonomuraea sp. K274]|uniref:Lipoprotein n=1 Tax=Nonomuraea cypriaca TaxID=1187855 RepID=A0A931A837_9ACTN|nr:hypothetical protein [Nonomuraea cypriaca]MBF8185733.1 hypothetical protein [Nonomuraea cypriaca]
MRAGGVWRVLIVLVSWIALVSCGGERQAGEPPATGPARASGTAAPAASTTPSAGASQSAFCLDLTTFNIALVAYSAEVGQAIEGKPVDFKEARRLAGVIARLGEGMEDSAPADIAEAFHRQLTAVRKSSGKLSTGNNAFDVVDPMYNDRADADQKALNEYKCG